MLFIAAYYNAVMETDISFFSHLDMTPILEYRPNYDNKSPYEKFIYDCLNLPWYIGKKCISFLGWVNTNLFWLITSTYETTRIKVENSIFYVGSYTYHSCYNVTQKTWTYFGGQELINALIACNKFGGGVFAYAYGQAYQITDEIVDFAFEMYKPHCKYTYVLNPGKEYRLLTYRRNIVVPLDLTKPLDKTKLMAIDLIYDKVKNVCEKHPWQVSAIITASSAVVLIFGVPLLPVVLVNPCYFLVANAMVTVAFPLISSETVLPDLVPINISPPPDPEVP